MIGILRQLKSTSTEDRHPKGYACLMGEKISSFIFLHSFSIQIVNVFNMYYIESCIIAVILFHYFLFCFFFIQLYVIFKVISAHMRWAKSVGERKRENPEKNHLAHPQAELGLSHVASARLEPTPDTAVR